MSLFDYYYRPESTEASGAAVLATASNPGSKRGVSFNDAAATHPFGSK